MKLHEPRNSSLSLKLTNGQYSALIEHSWARRQRISDLVRETLDGAGLLTMPGATTSVEASNT